LTAKFEKKGYDELGYVDRFYLRKLNRKKKYKRTNEAMRLLRNMNNNKKRKPSPHNEDDRQNKEKVRKTDEGAGGDEAEKKFDQIDKKQEDTETEKKVDQIDKKQEDTEVEKKADKEEKKKEETPATEDSIGNSTGAEEKKEQKSKDTNEMAEVYDAPVALHPREKVNKVDFVDKLVLAPLTTIGKENKKKKT